MTDVLDASALERWRAEPTRFVEEVLRDPESGRPFVLLPAELAFFAHAFRTGDDGRLLYPEQVYSAPKKSGKTALAALHTLVTTLIFGGSYAEGYCAANDLEQSRSRVFAAISRIVSASPLLAREARVLADRIEFSTGAVISAIASDYAGAAGANPTITSFDELWAYTTEKARRLWDEMVPPPTRKVACRLTVTYAGFEGESLLLEELCKRGLAQPQVAPDLHAGDGLLMFWTHEPVAPWQRPEWIEQMRRSLRPNAFLRMIENRFVSAESSFVDMEDWDRCVAADARPLTEAKGLPVWVGVDASVKHDQTAIVAVAFDKEAAKVRLVAHRVFQPTKAAPLDFEKTVVATLNDYRKRFGLRGVRFDPYQMAATAQRLHAGGVPMQEYPQSPPNLTAMGSNLYELIRSGGLVAYPDDGIRLAISRAVVKESDRGLMITKAKASHKVDLVVALAMACLAAVERGPWERANKETMKAAARAGLWGAFTQPRPSPGHADGSATMQAWNAIHGARPYEREDFGEALNLRVR